MARQVVDHSSVPIRLFRSDFLEFFTHISPIAVLLIWVPVVAYFLVEAIRDALAAGSIVHVPLAFVLGIFVWTLTEYLLHRFVFHFEPRSPRQERILFLFHGIHHAQPQLKTRLVMPPVVSIPLGFFFYAAFSLVVVHGLGLSLWLAPMFSGAAAGYVIYDMTHYATHHFPMRAGVFKFLKQYHMKHHYKTPDQRFGVSSPLWDYVFRTVPAEG